MVFYGPPGIKKMFRQIINFPYSMPVKQLKTKLKIRELTGNLSLPEGIQYRRLRHTGICYGYRVTAENKIMTFCTDTGPCRNLELLAKGADVLIAESSLPPGKVNKDWPHLNPEQAAKIAKDAGAKKLLLVHFDSGVYLTNKDRIKANSSARKTFRDTVATKDGLVINL
jgi:ribonuclease BN (tRNA processing enzyme)